jgi:hypothetical protein
MRSLALKMRHGPGEGLCVRGELHAAVTGRASCSSVRPNLRMPAYSCSFA